jgi:hypothetical protein
MITTTPGPLTPWPAVMCDCQVVIGLLLRPEMKSNKQLQQPDQVKLGIEMGRVLHPICSAAWN